MGIQRAGYTPLPAEPHGICRWCGAGGSHRDIACRFIGALVGSMKFIPITYKIALHSGLKTVTGQAFQHDGHRLCLRMQGDKWVVDDYDSGAYVGGLYESKNLAIKAATERLDFFGKKKAAMARQTAIARLRAGGLIE